MTSNNICKVAEFNDAVFLEAVCSCKSNNHQQTLIIEYDSDIQEVSTTLYTTVITENFTSWDSRYEYNEAMVEGNYLKMAYFKAKLLIEHIIARIKFTKDIWMNGFIKVENHFSFRGEAAIDDYIAAITSAKAKIKENKNESAT